MGDWQGRENGGCHISRFFFGDSIKNLREAGRRRVVQGSGEGAFAAKRAAMSSKAASSRSSAKRRPFRLFCL